jgi:hypothetical protein
MGIKAPIVVLLIGLVLASVHLAEAQEAKKVHRIGFLIGASAPSVAAVSTHSGRPAAYRNLDFVEEGAHGLRPEHYRPISAGRHLRGQNIKRHQAFGSASGAADEV